MIFSFSDKQKEKEKRILSSEIVDRIATLIFTRALDTKGNKTQVEKKSKLTITSSISSKKEKKLSTYENSMDLVRLKIIGTMKTVLSIISMNYFDDIVTSFYVHLQQHANEPIKAEIIISLMGELYLPVDEKNFSKSKQFITTSMGNFSRKHNLQLILSITEMVGQTLLLQAHRLEITSPEFASWREFVSNLKETKSSLKKQKETLVSKIIYENLSFLIYIFSQILFYKLVLYVLNLKQIILKQNLFQCWIN